MEEGINCRLCLLPVSEVGELKLSHIVSECFFTPIYDDKHRFVAISEENAGRLKYEQKGYRERLLCSNCENKLSRWENNSKKDFKDMSLKQYKHLDFITSPSPHDFLCVSNISHDYMKKFVLSVIWRMSLSSISEFSEYSLGEKHSENIRRILDNDEELDTYDYPILIHQVRIRNQYFQDLMMFMGRGELYDKNIVSFVVMGFLIDIFVSSESVKKDPVGALLLNSSDEVVVPNIEWSSLANRDPGLRRRLQDRDVTDFYGI